MTESLRTTTIEMMLGGDVMLGRGVNEMIHCFGPAYPFEPLRALLEPVDLVFVNLECAISAKDLLYSGPPKAFYFRADPIAVETLQHGRVNFVSLANNHALDADLAGLRDTIAILEQNRIQHAGAGENLEQASAPAYVECRGLRLAVIAYCDHQRDFAAERRRPGIRYVDLATPEIAAVLAEQVAAVAQTADHVIVSMHWQPNWAPHVLPMHRHLARRMLEAGARVVWGHSPHHFQGIEWIDRRVALLSTGDLIDDYAVDPEFRNDRQLLFRLALDEGGVTSVRAYPLQLELGRTRPADRTAWQWIVDRFIAMCEEVGSHVEHCDEYLVVHAGARPDPEAERDLKAGAEE